jgi:subtilisin-like proprotein convertase family protein
MANTKTTTTTKVSHYFRALVALVAMMAAMLVASGVALAATTFTNSSPIQIADSIFPDPGLANPYPSQINVQNLSGNINDIDLKLSGYSHNFPDDVAVLLVGPQGQKALLMSDVGGDDFGRISDVNLTLDDEATKSLPDNGQIASGTQITSGTYKPTRGTITSVTGDSTVPANFPAPAPVGPYATNLSVFDNTDPNGTWSLYVIDDTAGDTGQFAGGWSLEITTDAPTDTTAPKVTSTNPLPGATGVSPSTNVSATFSEDMNVSTINATTFKLFKKGSTTKLAATVAYDATTDKATLDPTNSLKRGATYKAVVSTGAKDLAGNALDQNPSLSGLQQKAWTFKVRN